MMSKTSTANTEIMELMCEWLFLVQLYLDLIHFEFGEKK